MRSFAQSVSSMKTMVRLSQRIKCGSGPAAQKGTRGVNQVRVPVSNCSSSNGLRPSDRSATDRQDETPESLVFSTFCRRWNGRRAGILTPPGALAARLAACERTAWSLFSSLVLTVSTFFEYKRISLVNH